MVLLTGPPVIVLADSRINLRNISCDPTTTYMNAKHPFDGDFFDAYLLKTLASTERAQLEEHLLVCQACREQLDRTEDFIASIRREARIPENGFMALNGRQPRRFIHDTEDGLIISEVMHAGSRKWVAHHWGPQLDGGRITRTLREAMDYLTESFGRMFPEHQCTCRCETVSLVSRPFGALESTVSAPELYRKLLGFNKAVSS